MSQRVLEKLFDSTAKLRLVRLFLRNPESKFTIADLRRRTLVQPKSLHRELRKLGDIKLVRSYNKKGVKGKIYTLNQTFSYLPELQALILKSSPADDKNLAKSIRALGRVKLAVLAGIFLKPEREDSRVDLLLVGDHIKDKKLNAFIRNLEAEVGTDIRYALISTEDFHYRYGMFDRFLLDTLEKPHRKLVNKLL